MDFCGFLNLRNYSYYYSAILWTSWQLILLGLFLCSLGFHISWSFIVGLWISIALLTICGYRNSIRFLLTFYTLIYWVLRLFFEDLHILNPKPQISWITFFSIFNNFKNVFLTQKYIWPSVSNKQTIFSKVLSFYDLNNSMKLHPSFYA